MWKKRRVQRNDSRTPLMTENNNNVQDGFNMTDSRYNSSLAQNTLNTHRERRLQSKDEITLQELAELLDVAPDDIANTFEDGCWCAIQPEPKSGQPNLKPNFVSLIKRSASKHFPEPPTALDQNLHQHLQRVQDTVLHELVRLGPLLEPRGLMGCLIDCYHHQTCDHLKDLLQNTTSANSTFMLINWVQHIYQSQELLGHPDLQEMDPIKKVDVLLFQEWAVKAKEKLLENVEKDVRKSLENILQAEIDEKHCDCEEAYVKLYVDIIQYIDAMHNGAKKISPDLPDRVQEICFQELRVFVRRYIDEQTEVLGKKAEMDEPETIHFLKTLKTCKELKQHVQTKGAGTRTSLLKELVGMFENMEASTLALLMGIVTDIAESHLKKYFKSDNKRFFLCADLERHFPKLPYSVDEQKRVMDEAYKLIVRIYIKHLLRSSRSKLKKRWGSDIGKTVREDAELLHRTFTDLAPGVQQWNLTLLQVAEILECNSLEVLKMDGATMQRHCLTVSEDMVLLPNLLRWKGLSKWKVTEVLNALPPDLQPGPDPGPQPRCIGSWYSCFTCLCCR
ncbi:exocyst complex component 3 isoform X2 [Trachinotus anak]|uniref:exocyst complex component 3 isoform X2 n=1 Tax=Trachinotus anak TaxID=443729 RepID=UPI0039F24C64